MKCTVLVLLAAAATSWAQGPQASYYYSPSTKLPWGQCYVYQRAGSQEQMPFLPVIGSDHAPLGTTSYSKDVNVDGLIVFTGDGIAGNDRWNGYAGRRLDYTSGELDVAGKVVMFCYDFPDSADSLFGNAFPVERRIRTATDRGASAVMLFSHRQQYPFLRLSLLADSALHKVPVITVTEPAAASILESAGVESHRLFDEWRDRRHPPESRALISRMHLWIEGGFRSVPTKYFSLHARKEEFSQQALERIAQVNEKAGKFVRTLFHGVSLHDEKFFIVYFGDYDSKVFYTHHWGKGLATDGMIFNVHEGRVPSFGLAVHETAHLLWGTNATSFLSEGLAMYAQAMAVDKHLNDSEAVQFMKSNDLFPLQEMMGFDIGTPGKQTDVGYPAAGSFVRYLIETYGPKLFHDVCLLEARPEEEMKKENSWEKVYHRSVPQLEQDWHLWLSQGRWRN